MNRFHRPKKANHSRGRYVSLIQNDKNRLEIIPNVEAIAEFIDDEAHHLPDDILIAAGKEVEMGTKRHGVWGDDQTLTAMLEDFLSNGWREIAPEDIGALTDAPILEAPDGRIYWHERYQVESAVEELVKGLTVKFDGAPENVGSSPAPVPVVPPPAMAPASVTPAAPMGMAPKESKVKKAKDEKIEDVAPIEDVPPMEEVTPIADAPPSTPMPGAGGNPFEGVKSETLINMIQDITGADTFATDKPEQELVEMMSEVLSKRPVEPELVEPKTAALAKAASALGKLGKKANWVKVAVNLPDNFTKGYFATALWSSMDNTNEQGGEPLDKNYNFDDFDPATAQKMVADCAKFQQDNDQWIQDEHFEGGHLDNDLDQRAGHDFWLTRNGHGSGFWDGDWSDEAGEAMTASARAFGEFDLYIGDDGKIYGSPLGASHTAASFPPTNDETMDILEGDQSIDNGKSEEEDHTGVEHPATTLPKDAAFNTTSSALAAAESMVDKLNKLYMEAKPIVKVNQTRPVREGVEAIYHAMQAMNGAVKVLAKQKSGEDEEEALQAAAKKKSSLLANLVLAGREEVKRIPSDGLKLAGMEDAATGAHGWPLVDSDRYPGEKTLACPKCGGKEVALGTQYPTYGTGSGGRGRLGDPGATDYARCNGCKHESRSPSKMAGMEDAATGPFKTLFTMTIDNSGHSLSKAFPESIPVEVIRHTIGLGVNTSGGRILFKLPEDGVNGGMDELHWIERKYGKPLRDAIEAAYEQQLGSKRAGRSYPAKGEPWKRYEEPVVGMVVYLEGEEVTITSIQDGMCEFDHDVDGTVAMSAGNLRQATTIISRPAAPARRERPARPFGR